MDQLSPDGPVYQAGTLSGNPMAMAAGLAQIKELILRGGWSRLEELGAKLEEGIRCAIAGRPITFHRIGSMFCLYFCEGPVRNLTEAARSDRQRFARYFHASLDGGVYFAPSQFEAGFLSLAHSEADIEQSVRVAAAALQAAGDE